MLSNETTSADKRPLVLPSLPQTETTEHSDLWLALGRGKLFTRLFHLSSIAKTLHLALYHAGDDTDDAFGVVAEFISLEIDKTTDEIAALLLVNGVVAPAEKNN